MFSRPAVGMTLALALLAALGAAALAGETPDPWQALMFPETAATDTSGYIVLEFRDTTVGLTDSVYRMPLYFTLPECSLAGVDIWFGIDRPDLVEPVLLSGIDTTVYCFDSLNCDTFIDTITDGPLVDIDGSAIEHWRDSLGILMSAMTMRYVHWTIWKSEMVPPADTARYMFGALTRPIVPQSVLDTMQDRSVHWYFLTMSNFATPGGTSIGRRDSLVCLNPPVCDSLDTVYYSVNTFVEGTLQIGPPCRPGDVNWDGIITAADIIALISNVFKSGPEPACSGMSGDVNCSGETNSADVIHLVNFVFKSGPPPCEL